MNAIIRARLDRIIRDLDGAIAAVKHDRAVRRSLWRARAEIVRAKAAAESPAIKPGLTTAGVNESHVSLTHLDGDVKDLGAIV